MRRYKKSIWMPVVLLIYTTGMALYFLPKNTEISSTEKWATIAASYVIIALLWYVLRKKEKHMQKNNQNN